MESVKLCITEGNDELTFRTSCGVSLGGFLELLSFYLKATFVGWHKDLFVQKSGVCNGSRVPPTLREIFLSRVDRLLEKSLLGLHKRAFRYVEDYLILLDRHDHPRVCIDILKVFKECGSGSKLTFEPSKANELQFLDLKLEFLSSHVCWGFFPRSTEPLLQYGSAHSRLVRNGTALSCICPLKVCPLKIMSSFF